LLGDAVGLPFVNIAGLADAKLRLDDALAQ
jgi:hypothetical protein